MLKRMTNKEKATESRAKKTVQFNPSVPEVTLPRLAVSFHSKKKNDEIVLKRLKKLVVDNESAHHNGMDRNRVS